MAPAVRVTEMDHIVLVVRDVETSAAWYGEALGLEVLRLDGWRAGEVPFPSVRITPDTIIDLLPAGDRPAPGQPRRELDHLCLVVEPTDLEALRTSGRLDVVEGPAPRWGARGTAQSLYVRDPDGHVVELRHYGQPTRTDAGSSLT